MPAYLFPALYTFADAYGSGPYGAGIYGCDSATNCASTTTPPANSSTLTNTGIAVGLVVGVACLLLLLAVLARFWRRPAQKSVKQQVPPKPNANNDHHI